MTEKIVIVVQARMSSTRLPGKVLKEILGKPLIAYLLERLERVEGVDRVVVATSTDSSDDPIAAFCAERGTDCFRGSLDDVLARYYHAAKAYAAEVVIRICSDCPLLDPELVDQMIERYKSHSPDYLCNFLERTYPRGQEVEIFSIASLERAFLHAKEPNEREHVTPYIYLHPELFTLENVASKNPIHKNERWVVDTEEDFVFMRRLIEGMHPSIFSLEAVGAYLEKHPELIEINKHVRQKCLYSSSLKPDPTGE